MGEDPACGLQRRLPFDRPRRAHRPRPAARRARAVRRRRRSRSTPSAPFVLVMQHPVTTEYGPGFDQINQTLEAVAAVGMQALVFWPNVDAGSEHVAKGIRGLPRARPGARLPLLPQPAAGGLRPADGALRLHGRELVRGAARGLVPRHAGVTVGHAPAGPRARPEPGRGRPRPGADRRRDPRPDRARPVRAQLPLRRRHGGQRRSPTSWSSCARRFRSG